MNHGEQLIERFVATFEKLDDRLVTPAADPISAALVVGAPDIHGFRHWMPVKWKTDRSHLQKIYDRLPARFPPLFERLVLSYRWAEVDLQLFRLLANPPGPDLAGLLGEMTKDQFLSSHLLQSKLIPFGKGADMDYDPVCFDLSARKKNADYRIVKIDHEEILCNSRIKVVKELAPTFRQLVTLTIHQASST
jgi:hypothetical protein